MATKTAAPMRGSSRGRANITPTVAPRSPQSSQTDCDGVGTLFCPPLFGTCYTGLDGYIGCCSTTSCYARTTCIPYYSTASIDCDENTGGCQRCTDVNNPECVTLTNVLMDQYALYCSAVSLYSELSYFNLVSTGSTAPFAPRSSASSRRTASSTPALTSTTQPVPSTTSPPKTTSPPPSQGSNSQVPIIVGVAVSCSTLVMILLLVGCVVHKKYVEIQRWHHFLGFGAAKRPKRRWPIEKDDRDHHRSLPLTSLDTPNSARFSELHGDSTTVIAVELGGDGIPEAAGMAEGVSLPGRAGTRWGYTAVPLHSPDNAAASWSPSTLESHSTDRQSSRFSPISPNVSRDSMPLNPVRAPGSPELSPMLGDSVRLSVRNPSPPSPPPLETMPLDSVLHTLGQSSADEPSHPRHPGSLYDPLQRHVDYYD